MYTARQAKMIATKKTVPIERLETEFQSRLEAHISNGSTELSFDIDRVVTTESVSHEFLNKLRQLGYQVTCREFELEYQLDIRF